MVSIQIRDVPEQVRDTLATLAHSRGQSMQAYLRGLLEEDACRANNIDLLKRVREVGGGYSSETGEAAQTIAELRAERDRRNAGDA
ncbi:FitA-like ribbon-helix-helix domain-containing protein [Amycolatopsis alkalitolerans]|uniref:Antitoxin FitA-like ribbon-helix-helix domain-containing protein n=1 Tax=Amycolatopsis alkalitolerans TaxID=2547244 RepID=A0A5C4M605_9PSEU|nr:hypothetical protein [Amycolatopsis alkalitolerans]TNC28562.1 hypothetical protein FG385_04635 [Amycolatopsis alkalitolerans]